LILCKKLAHGDEYAAVCLISTLLDLLTKRCRTVSTVTAAVLPHSSYKLTVDGYGDDSALCSLHVQLSGLQLAICTDHAL
jgi:hypothetical protein